jgi:hypothetical protein
MRPLSPLLLCASLLVACPSAEEAGDFFLLEAGNTWTYTLIQGGNGEEWTLSVLDAAENQDSSRGDLWFYMTRPEPSNDPQDPDAVIDFPVRSFNVSLEADSTGEEPIPIGYTYRFVGQGEGDRNEFFVKYPGDNATYTESWEYEVENELGTNRFEYSIETRHSTDEVETGLGNWSDNILVDRVVTQINIDGAGNEVPFEQTHQEVWAAGAGLVRYRFVSVDEEVTEAVMRTSTAFSID